MIDPWTVQRGKKTTITEGDIFLREISTSTGGLKHFRRYRVCESLRSEQTSVLLTPLLPYGPTGASGRIGKPEWVQMRSLSSCVHLLGFPVIPEGEKDSKKGSWSWIDQDHIKELLHEKRFLPDGVETLISEYCSPSRHFNGVPETEVQPGLEVVFHDENWQLRLGNVIGLFKNRKHPWIIYIQDYEPGYKVSAYSEEHLYSGCFTRCPRGGWNNWHLPWMKIWIALEEGWEIVFGVDVPCQYKAFRELKVAGERYQEIMDKLDRSSVLNKDEWQILREIEVTMNKYRDFWMEARDDYYCKRDLLEDKTYGLQGNRGTGLTSFMKKMKSQLIKLPFPDIPISFPVIPLSHPRRKRIGEYINGKRAKRSKK